MFEVLEISYSIAEIDQQLAWLGAALRSSPCPADVVCCMPVVGDVRSSGKQTMGGSPKYSWHIDFIVDEMVEESRSAPGKCWHRRFRNPVIVKGYPIPRRLEYGTGLEISLKAMATLAETRWLNHHNGYPFVKGFSVVPFPTRKTSEACIWHMIHNPTWDRVPYPGKGAMALEDVSNFDLEGSRHILG